MIDWAHPLSLYTSSSITPEALIYPRMLYKRLKPVIMIKQSHPAAFYHNWLELRCPALFHNDMRNTESFGHVPSL